MNTSPNTARFTLTLANSHPLAANSRDSPPAGIARIYDSVAIHTGTPNGFHITADVLSDSLDKWAGAGVYVDHPGLFDGPSVRNLIGAFRQPRFSADTGQLSGDLCLFDLDQARPTIALLDLILQQRDAGHATPPVGLSAVLSLTWEERDDQRFVTAIRKVWSVDVVHEPAAEDAHIQKILNSQQLTMNEIQTPTPDAPITIADLTPAANSQSPVAPPPTSSQPPVTTNQLATELTQALLAAQCQQLLEVRLSTSQLPATVQAALRSRFVDRTFAPAELDTAIGDARALAAAFAGDSISGMGQPARAGGHRVSSMFSEVDQVQAAYEQLMRVPLSNPQLRNVPRLSGIRELYVGLTGDRDLYGRYEPSHAMFAVTGADTPRTSAIFADLTANVQNKIVLDAVNRMAAAGYMWWKRAAAVGHFTNLQPARYIRIGGVGDLPTIAEGGIYSELTWDDTSQAVPFVKKGGYLALTLEMIDRDDTDKWRKVGDALGTAAMRTLSNAVAQIFITNPTLTEDGLNLFHATHANLGVAALSGANWDTAVQSIFKAPEFNSTKRLGLRPNRVLVPIELRKTALSIFYSVQEPGTPNNDINVAGIGTAVTDDGPVIVVPEFTDTNDWVALCDPDLAPVASVGFRYGETPEIMSAADPSSHLLFFQDALPVKARYFYAVGAVDWRGAFKSVVP